MPLIFALYFQRQPAPNHSVYNGSGISAITGKYVAGAAGVHF